MHNSKLNLAIVVIKCYQSHKENVGYVLGI